MLELDRTISMCTSVGILQILKLCWISFYFFVDIGILFNQEENKTLVLIKVAME